MSKEEPKGKELCVVQSFAFFCVINFSVSIWLIQGSDKSLKGYDWVPCSLMCLRIPLPPVYAGSKFWVKWKTWPLGAASIPTYSVISRTYLPCIPLSVLDSHAWWVPRNAVLRGFMTAACGRAPRNGRHTLCVALLGRVLHRPSDFIYKHGSGCKVIKNSWWRPQSVKGDSGPF